MKYLSNTLILCKKLTNLNLRDNNIGVEGALYLSNLIKHLN